MGRYGLSKDPESDLIRVDREPVAGQVPFLGSIKSRPGPPSGELHSGVRDECALRRVFGPLLCEITDGVVQADQQLSTAGQGGPDWLGTL